MTQSPPGVNGAAPTRRRSAIWSLIPARLSGVGFAVILCVSVAASEGARADADVFTVAGVKVDQTADTAAAARDEAVAVGQRKALERLFERIVLTSEANRLPAVGNAAVTELVRDFEVIEEKTSAVRYLATLRVRFKPEAIRALLRNQGIAFAETRSRPVLVLPIYRQGRAYSLWGDPNPWRDAWQAMPPLHGLVPLVHPKGDDRDASLIDAEQALQADEGRLRMIAQRYGAASVLIAVAGFAADSRGTASGSRGSVLQVTVGRVGGARYGQTRVEAFRPREGEAGQALLERAVRTIAADVQERWKHDNRLRFGAGNRLEVMVPLDSLADWLDIKRRLGEVALIRGSDLLYLSRSEALLSIDFIGDAEQLTLALVQNDLILERGVVTWVLRRVGKGGGRGNGGGAKGVEPEGERMWRQQYQ